MIFRFSFEFWDSSECQHERGALLLQFESPLRDIVGTDLRFKRIVLQAWINIDRLLDHPPEGSIGLGSGVDDHCRSVVLLL